MRTEYSSPPQPDTFNPYDSKPVFNLWEAAAALRGITRIADEDLPILEPLLNDLKRAIQTQQLVPLVEGHEYDPIYPHHASPLDYWKGTELSRETLLAWCTKRQLCPPLLFPEPLSEDPSPATTGDLLGGYRTPEIDALIAAVHEFWLHHHDSAKPPKREVIRPWVEQRGVSRNMAAAIDSIIRPLSLRKGGQKKSRSPSRSNP